MIDPAAAPTSTPPGEPVSPAPGKPKKPLGPIRWRMILGVLFLWIATGVGLFVMRDRIVKHGVVTGGRSAFQSAVSLEEARSGLSPARTAIDLKGLEVPDRADLGRNLFQVEQLELEVSPLDLLAGQVHVAHARARNVGIDVARKTPAEPLPLAEPAPIESDDGSAGSFLGGLLGDEGSLIDALTVSQKPFADLVHALGLESVAYAEGLPGRLEASQKEWGPKLEAHKQELEALQARSKALQPKVDALAKSIREEWSRTLAEKKKKLDELEQSLKKDSKAAGQNPLTDIPRRVDQELADLDQVKGREEARTAEVRGELEQLEGDLARLAGELERLDKEAKAAQQQLADEVTKARKATKADLEKIKGWVDPSGDKVDELLHFLCGPRTAAQVKSARKWVGLLWRLIPPKAKRIAPPASAREGVEVPIPPPPGGEQAARDALARLLIDDLELDANLALEEGPLQLVGHVRNLSDAPFLVGREIGLELDGTLGTGETARRLKIGGSLNPEGERTRLQVTCTGMPLQGLVLREGAPAPNDLFPRKVERVTLDLELKVEQGPDGFAIAIDAKLTDLSWGPAPANEGAAAVRAVRSVLAGMKGLHLAVELNLPRAGKPSMSVKDLSTPKLTDALRESITAAVQGEVERVTANYQAELEKTLAGKADGNQAALDASRSAWAKQLAGATDLQKKSAPPGSSSLDQAVSSGDGAKKALAEEAVPRLLKAATQGGGLQLPKGIPNPFGKD